MNTYIFTLSIFLKIVLLLFLYFTSTLFGFAQTTPTWHFDTYNDNNSSIPHNFINDLAFDKTDNSLWIATGGGLVHWSEKDSIIYTPKNSDLKDYGIKCITVGKDGDKYIGTYGAGIYKIDIKGQTSHLHVPSKSNKNTVLSIKEDQHKTIWVGTEEEGLFRIDSKFQTLISVEKIAFTRVFEIIVDKNNTKWIATERGLYTLDNNNRLKIYPSLKDQPINSIAFSPKNQLLISSTLESTAQFFVAEKKQNPSKDVHYQFRTMLPTNENLWVASLSGLSLFENDKWTVFNPQNSAFPSTMVSTLAQNPKDNTIWAGTYGQGLVKLSQLQKLPKGEFRLGTTSIKKGDVVRLHIGFERATAIFNDTTGISELVEFMTENKTIRIELSGHTDTAGDATLNYKLSQERADAVKLYLMRKNIEANRIETKAYGGTKPISNNKNELSRQKNRRVEMRIIE
ncbi:outer membrane protein/peptidoglycan-associated (lipo)protein [Bernardetia litoralis DSM 6794]|uniref:Outer membrane protein/peptidoglycan-associated (Lipo)protein n=1 Tax=Bernardetia litoralis (strain ATCC 23117 / DSM 6794 / NBRC 15988 / NCIMB 1366 / Fx l1 / Sio-4) TaxID=880071 RepID=I4AKC2_BERLS|nr:OmpA family protein [Bernardetia litoralis]AFM04407.1 outer membrane protein/peptidoglycan-associated (lipo)protein [Bernardetia litoralis DSM 6794]